MPTRRSPVLRIAMISTAGREETRAATLSHLGDTALTRIFIDMASSTRGNHLASWTTLFADPTVTHGLLLHDDIRAPQGWTTAVRTFAERFPDQMAVSFYSPHPQASGANQNTRNTQRGHFMLPARTWQHEQALMLRREVVVGFRRWLEAEEYINVVPYQHAHRHDLLLAGFLASRGVDVMCAAPSLFQHHQSDPMKRGVHQAKRWRGPQWDAGEYFTQRAEPTDVLGAVNRFRNA